MAAHESLGKSTDWQTPPHIIAALPRFDFDPCASQYQRTDTAKLKIHWPENGLAVDWHGTVWLNPPYGTDEIRPFLKRMVLHNHGVALLPGRIDTRWFHQYVWPHATAAFVFRGRIPFIASRLEAKVCNAMFPSLLVSYGDTCCMWLRNARLDGIFIDLTNSEQQKPGSLWQKRLFA